jgi:hypothetical protein
MSVGNDPDSNDDRELATLSISQEEDGSSFGLRESWPALASTCMSVNAEIKTIRKPGARAAEGALIDLFGAAQMLELLVAREDLILRRQGLDSPEPVPVLEVDNDPAGWKRIRSAAQYFLGARRR